MASASSLSRLLQRARVSTYDPRISQVYHAPVAHAARGDFGLKRPLPSSWHSTPDAAAPAAHPGALRYARVRRLDTEQGLTDWSESERDVLFRARWQEKGARLSDRARRDVLAAGTGDEDTNAALGPRPRIVYDAATCTDRPEPAHVVWGANHARFADHADVLPNYNAMSEKEFRQFLAQIRRRRGKFRAALVQQRREATEHALLEQLARERRRSDADAASIPESDWQAARTTLPASRVDLWTEARLPHAPQSAASFLRTEAQSAVGAPHSRDVSAPVHAAPAHPLRGLQYAQPDSVYSYLLSEPVRGRAVHRVEDNRRNRYFVGADAGLAVVAGGHVGHLSLQHRNGLDTVDFSRSKPERGTADLRVLYAWLDTKGVPSAARRTPRNTEATEPELGYVRMQLMALRDGAQRPTPGTRQWVDDPAKKTPASWSRAALGGGADRGDGSLFGALARNGRGSSAGAQRNAKRQGLQRRRRNGSASSSKDVQMLDNIKNLLSPQ
ncbi:hypothetical protein MSPP1_001077 [Malassezia sp. CBS 17886]|nr:hypothetical protein MSPP1_001077 [Malassezia sp. CBS 17886]